MLISEHPKFSSYHEIFSMYQINYSITYEEPSPKTSYVKFGSEHDYGCLELFSFSETARITGVTPKAVRTRAHKRNIEVVLVNERPMIPRPIAYFEKKKIEKIKAVEMEDEEGNTIFEKAWYPEDIGDIVLKCDSTITVRPNGHIYRKNFIKGKHCPEIWIYKEKFIFAMPLKTKWIIKPCSKILNFISNEGNDYNLVKEEQWKKAKSLLENDNFNTAIENLFG